MTKKHKISLQFIILQVFVVVFLLLDLTAAYSQWEEMTSGTEAFLSDIWGSSGSDVFAVGENGTILHYDGISWSAMDSGTDEFISGVWGSSGSNVFAVGNFGTILHYNGISWSAMTSGVPFLIFLRDIWGSSGSNVFAVASDSHILHYDGSAWSVIAYWELRKLFGVWVNSDSDVFAVGADYDSISSVLLGAILHYDGNSWSATEIETDFSFYFTGVWGSSGSDVFAVGYGGRVTSTSIETLGKILHYNGTEWSDSYISADARPEDVWGSSGSDVFVVGNGLNNMSILHYDGTSWNYMTIDPFSGMSLNAVWGSSGKDVFAVGALGSIVHYSGVSTTTTVINICPIEQIYGEQSEETELLRYFRDAVLSQTPEGQEIIRLYYQWSPMIVKMMDEDEEFKGEVKEMIDGVVEVIGG